MPGGPRLLPLLLAALACAAPGCHMLLPEVTHQPLVHNPFPQLSRVAVAPFFNQSDEPTVDGRQFAMAYFSELQTIRGFEVVPLGVVEEAILRHQVDLSHPEEARRLARLLGVDAVVVGSVTDFSPYYPPRCGMRVEWYTANPGFHAIPAGYGLPWGTPEEEFIPESLVFEAEMALAREQLATQTPESPAAWTPEGGGVEVETTPPRELVSPQEVAEPLPAPPAAPEEAAAPAGLRNDAAGDDAADDASEEASEEAGASKAGGAGAEQASHEAPLAGPGAAAGTIGAGAAGASFPAGWPDARGFVPPGPSPVRPAMRPHDGPVMTHTRIYQGNNPDFTAALASYVSFRDDARFGGWQSYLERSDDFIRFCAHMHLAEMLTARGGGGETRVVRRWSQSR